MIFSCFHEKRSQVDQEASLAELRNGEVPILITTDMATKGINIRDLTLIINYSFPLNIEEYVHRMGKIGRAEKIGEMISLFSKKDVRYASTIIKILENCNQSIPDTLYKRLKIVS